MSVVMERVRAAAARAAAGVLAGDRERPSFPRVTAQSPFPPDVARGELVARFRAELETLLGRVYGPFDADGVAARVVDLVRGAVAQGPGPGDRGAAGGSPLAGGEGMGEGSQPPARALSWDEAELGCPGLGEALRRAGIELVPGLVPNDERHHQALRALAELEVGVSGAVAGLADTGSIVVASGPGRSRVASLLPPVHVAVLPVSRLYPTLHEWLAGGGAAMVAREANVVIITGPSRTSDIEMQLTLGMHGPKELHVVLYGD